LQCLLSSQQLVDYFSLNNYKNGLFEFNSTNEIADEFYVLVKAIWGDGCSVISPFKLRCNIGKLNQLFISNTQQDSHEFLFTLLNGLHEDMNKVSN
jgi:ubiquitin C-terminal hydrolase